MATIEEKAAALVAPYKNLPPLPTEKAADGKSIFNPPRQDGKLSAAYERFPDPIKSENNGFDIHGNVFPNKASLPIPSLIEIYIVYYFQVCL
jgi:hypothetical protein